MIRPGEYNITEEAIQAAGMLPGSRILDIGCGEGETVKYMSERGFRASGIDISRELIEKGSKKFPNLDIKYGDGEFLEGYPSNTMDAVIMECVLSTIPLPDECLHEVCCVLKAGGKLILSDLYERDVNQQRLDFLKEESEKQSHIPFNRETCGEKHERHVSFRYKGKFVLEHLIPYLENELGFKIIYQADKSNELLEYAGELILNGISPEQCYCKANELSHAGYFLIIAEKQEAFSYYGS